MEYGVRHQVAGLAVPAFLRLWEQGERLVLASFTPLPAGWERADYEADIIADDEASAILAAIDGGDLSGLAHGQIWTAGQIGCALQPAGTAFWLRSWIDWTHGDPGFGREEIKGIQDWYVTIDREGVLHHPFNKFVLGAVTKDHGGSDLRRMGRGTCLQVLAPFEGLPLAECLINVVHHTDYGFAAVGATFENRVPIDDLRAGWFHNFLPRITLAAPASLAAGDMADIPITITCPDTGEPLTGREADVYLEATAGYLPRRRVHCAPQGTARLRAMDLDAGEVIKLKAGWRNFPGVAESLIEIV